MDVIITSNSPGELSAWVAPIVARWRERYPDWKFYLALVPCPFASGHEADFAQTIPGITAIWNPKQTLRILLGGKLPIPRTERGLVVYLGGDAWHAWRLSRRWRYSCVAYAIHDSFLWRWYSRVATQRTALAEKLKARGINCLHVGYVGRTLPERSERQDDTLYIGLFPGSRLLLLRYTLGPFLEIAKRLSQRLKKVRFILAVAPFVNKAEFQDVLAHPGNCGIDRAKGVLNETRLAIEGGPEIEVNWGMSRQVLERIDCAISIPGTNTGEIAAAGKALIVGLSTAIPIPRGGLGWIVEHMPGFKSFRQRQHMRYYKHHHFAAQPNRWAGEMIAPEVMVHDDLNVIVDKAVELFGDKEQREALGQRLSALMGDPGEAAERLADFLAGED